MVLRLSIYVKSGVSEREERKQGVFVSDSQVYIILSLQMIFCISCVL